MCVATFLLVKQTSLISLMRLQGVRVSFPLYPHCDTVTPSQPSSCTAAFATTSLCGTHPLNDLQWHRTDWLFSLHLATSVKQHCLNNGFFFFVLPTLSVSSPGGDLSECS